MLSERSTTKIWTVGLSGTLNIDSIHQGLFEEKALLELRTTSKLKSMQGWMTFNLISIMLGTHYIEIGHKGTLKRINETILLVIHGHEIL